VKDEPDLCPDCPFKSWWPEAIRRIKAREMIRTGERPPNLKICMELRKCADRYELLGRCPYFGPEEQITNPFYWR